MLACGIICIIWGAIGSFMYPFSNAGGIGIVAGIGLILGHNRLRRIEAFLSQAPIVFEEPDSDVKLK